MSARDRIAENPFYVLGVAPRCSAMEAERAGQKWLAMLELGLSEAAAYATPLGGFPRTPDAVRRALDELRDPARRLQHELWALDPERELEAAGPEPEAPRLPDALAALGWTRGG